jgi:threonine/homoserine/homoserine lactone efflux protein
VTAFLVVSVLVIVAPGPDFALTAGVATVLVASRPAFDALRLAGAAYLT